MNSGSNIRIVHPRTPETERIALRLARELAGYRIPRDIRRRTGIRGTAEISGPWLIVLCTPETPADPEIREEITSFRNQGAFQRILTLLVSGTPEESFPKELTAETLADGTSVDREPLAANISAPSVSARLRKLRVEKLRLLAPMLGVSFDDLRNRRRVQRMKVLIPVCAAAGIAALLFLGYALNRVRILSDQNRQLNAQLDTRRESLAEAESRRDAAEADYTRRIAEKARNELSQQHTETALLLCLEMLPEHAGIEELTGAFREALETAYSAGYSPVDNTLKRRPGRQASSAGTSPEMRKRFPYGIILPVPRELDTDTQFLRMDDYPEVREDLLCGYYSCKVETRNGESLHYSWFHFPDDPEKDFMLRDAAGNPAWIYTGAFLPDDTFVAYLFSDQLCRVNLLTGEMVPVQDEPEERFAGIRKILYEPGMGCVLAHTKSKAMHVFSVSPFAYLETVEEIETMNYSAEANIVCSWDAYSRGDTLKVFSADPFRLLYTITPGENERYERLSMACTGPGKGYLAVNRRVYDLFTGELLTDLEPLFPDGIEERGSFSADGCLMLTVGREALVWDQNTRTVRASFASPPCSFSSSSDWALDNSGIYWHWRDAAVPVPDGIDEQINMAVDFLEGASFSYGERTRFNLD